MKLWHVEMMDEIVTLDIGRITILKGSHKKWFRIARRIQDFFSNRTSEVKIYEDGHLINKSDWECFMIPYNESIHLDKINSKSPLQFIHEKIVDSLVSSPQYAAILEEWEILKEEEEVINKMILEKFDLQFELKEFDAPYLKDFIVLSSKKGMLTPIDIKILALKLLLEKELMKRLLIIVELPELYAEEHELGELLFLLNQLVNRGCMVMMITNIDDIKGRRNWILKGEVVNEAKLEMLKPKVFNTVPLPIDNEDFLIAKDTLLSSVDKVSLERIFSLDLRDIHNKHIVILYIILKLLGIEWKVDFTAFPANLRKFFAGY